MTFRRKLDIIEFYDAMRNHVDIYTETLLETDKYYWTSRSNMWNNKRDLLIAHLNQLEEQDLKSNEKCCRTFIFECPCMSEEDEFYHLYLIEHDFDNLSQDFANIMLL